MKRSAISKPELLPSQPQSCFCCLQGLLDRWGALSLERQQQVFDAVLVAAGQGAWEQLEARLRAALGRSDATSS